jgi:PAS domain S-box-containing protein
MTNPAKLPTELEEHFVHLVRGVQDYAIFLLSPTGIILSWNEGARHFKGYDAGEIIGQSFTRFYSDEANAAGWPQEELRRAAEHGRFEDEGWRYRKDGSRFWANVAITALRDEHGDVRSFLKITRDLTERKQAEETLRQSEERFRMLVESVQDYAIFMLDPSGHIVSWNAGAARIKGYQQHEIIGKHFSVFYTSEDLVSELPRRELEEAAAKGRVENEGWRVRKDRSQFWANVVITPIYGKDHELRGFAKVTRDLTERRQVELLQIADKQKNEFLAMLAHELRNPLAPISNALQLLKMPKIDESATLEITEMMERQVFHLVRLVDDLLDVSRIVTGKIALRKEPMEVGAAVSRAVEEVKPAIDARGHELIVTVPARPIIIDGDLVRIAQVVTSLLTNAAKYSSQPSQVWLSVQRNDDRVQIRVQDQGEGIDPKVLPNIFNVFVQADHSLARSQGGLGIGLTLVKRIVEMHGGSVTASSGGAGQGSEFVVSLPIPEEIDNVRVLRDRQPAPWHFQRRILVVDDNVDSAITVSKLLKLWGHNVQTVFNGPAALEMARDFNPEIMLLDIGLPGMSGYEVARQLRADSQFKELIIAAMTGYGQAEDRQRSRDAGINHHLTKPANPVLLESLVRSPESFSVH